MDAQSKKREDSNENREVNSFISRQMFCVFLAETLQTPGLSVRYILNTFTTTFTFLNGKQPLYKPNLNLYRSTRLHWRNRSFYPAEYGRSRSVAALTLVTWN